MHAASTTVEATASMEAATAHAASAMEPAATAGVSSTAAVLGKERHGRKSEQNQECKFGNNCEWLRHNKASAPRRKTRGRVSGVTRFLAYII
jgi:hypothetical protein